MEKTIIRDGIALPKELEQAVNRGAKLRIDTGRDNTACEIEGSRLSIIAAAGILLRDIASQVKRETDEESAVIHAVAHIALEISRMNQEAAAAGTGDAI